eukprot:TRINITY_DN9625_c0_g1_i1.p1 TRINITY_DN9625_c0_g1~~TRINITY_DN9625_c0_g1_i1.p1  ORF type:complete len:1168 (+),score=225.18 TRINITY_DN9625_c0_g1_i1:44-3547(+)
MDKDEAPVDLERVSAALPSSPNNAMAENLVITKQSDQQHEILSNETQNSNDAAMKPIDDFHRDDAIETKRSDEKSNDESELSKHNDHKTINIQIAQIDYGAFHTTESPDSNICQFGETNPESTENENLPLKVAENDKDAFQTAQTLDGDEKEHILKDENETSTVTNAIAGECSVMDHLSDEKICLEPHSNAPTLLQTLNLMDLIPLTSIDRALSTSIAKDFVASAPNNEHDPQLTSVADTPMEESHIQPDNESLVEMQTKLQEPNAHQEENDSMMPQLDEEGRNTLCADPLKSEIPNSNISVDEVAHADTQIADSFPAISSTRDSTGNTLSEEITTNSEAVPLTDLLPHDHTAVAAMEEDVSCMTALPPSAYVIVENTNMDETQDVLKDMIVTKDFVTRLEQTESKEKECNSELTQASVEYTILHQNVQGASNASLEDIREIEHDKHGEPSLFAQPDKDVAIGQQESPKPRPHLSGDEKVDPELPEHIVMKELHHSEAEEATGDEIAIKEQHSDSSTRVQICTETNAAEEVDQKIPMDVNLDIHVQKASHDSDTIQLLPPVSEVHGQEEIQNETPVDANNHSDKVIMECDKDALILEPRQIKEDHSGDQVDLQADRIHSNEDFTFADPTNSSHTKDQSDDDPTISIQHNTTRSTILTNSSVDLSERDLSQDSEQMNHVVDDLSSVGVRMQNHVFTTGVSEMDENLQDGTRLDNTQTILTSFSSDRSSDSDEDRSFDARMRLNRDFNIEDSVRWTDSEHEKFLISIILYGRDFAASSRLIGSKTEMEVQDHFLDYFSGIENYRISLHTSSKGASQSHTRTEKKEATDTETESCTSADTDEPGLDDEESDAADKVTPMEPLSDSKDRSLVVAPKIESNEPPKENLKITIEEVSTNQNCDQNEKTSRDDEDCMDTKQAEVIATTTAEETSSTDLCKDSEPLSIAKHASDKLEEGDRTKEFHNHEPGPSSHADKESKEPDNCISDEVQQQKKRRLSDSQSSKELSPSKITQNLPTISDSQSNRDTQPQPSQGRGEKVRIVPANYPGTTVFYPSHGPLVTVDPIENDFTDFASAEEVRISNLHAIACDSMLENIIRKYRIQQPKGPDFHHIYGYLDRLIRPSANVDVEPEEISDMEAEIIQLLFHQISVGLAHKHLKHLRNHLANSRTMDKS